MEAHPAAVQEVLVLARRAGIVREWWVADERAPDPHVPSYDESATATAVRIAARIAHAQEVVLARSSALPAGLRGGAGQAGFGHTILELCAERVRSSPPWRNSHWRGRLASGPATRRAFAALRCPTVIVIRSDEPSQLPRPGTSERRSCRARWPSPILRGRSPCRCFRSAV